MLWIGGYGVSCKVFDPVIDAYRDRFDCITFDNRGAGRSGTSWLPFSIADLAADAVRVLDAHGVDAGIVYGTSMGGMVAQEMALRFPDRVRGLILGATSPGGVRAALAPALDLARLLRLNVRAEASGVPAQIAERLFSDEFRADHGALANGYLSLIGWARPGARGALLQAWASGLHDTSSRLHRLKLPTLVLHGEADRLAPVSNAYLLKEHIPHAVLAIISKAGHAYWLEQPNLCRQLIADWSETAMLGIPDGLGTLEGLQERITRVSALQIGALRGCRTVLASGWRATRHW